MDEDQQPGRWLEITVCQGVCFSMRLTPLSQRASNIPRNQPAKKIFGPSIHHRKRLKRAALGRQPFPRDGSAKYFFFTQNANAPFMDALCPGGWARYVIVTAQSSLLNSASLQRRLAGTIFLLEILLEGHPASLTVRLVDC